MKEGIILTGRKDAFETSAWVTRLNARAIGMPAAARRAISAFAAVDRARRAPTRRQSRPPCHCHCHCHCQLHLHPHRPHRRPGATWAAGDCCQTRPAARRWRPHAPPTRPFDARPPRRFASAETERGMQMRTIVQRQMMQWRKERSRRARVVAPARTPTRRLWRPRPETRRQRN